MTRPARLEELLAVFQGDEPDPAGNRRVFRLTPDEVTDLIATLQRVKLLESQRARLLEQSNRAVRLLLRVGAG